MRRHLGVFLGDFSWMPPNQSGSVKSLREFLKAGPSAAAFPSKFWGLFSFGFWFRGFFGRSPSTLRTVAFGDPEPWHSRRCDVMLWGGNQAVYCAALGTRWIKRGFGEVSYILK